MRYKIIVHLRRLTIIANFKSGRKLSYSKIGMKKRKFSVANFWQQFEANGIAEEKINQNSKSHTKSIRILFLFTVSLKNLDYSVF